MAAKSRRWKYRDPSWVQVVWLYGLAVILAFVDSSPNRLGIGIGIGLAVVVTALVVIKVVRGPTQAPDKSAG